MRVTVERVDYFGGTIAYGYGTDEVGDAVKFAGDWRPMRDISEALDAGEFVEVDLEGWELL